MPLRCVSLSVIKKNCSLVSKMIMMVEVLFSVLGFANVSYTIGFDAGFCRIPTLSNCLDIDDKI